MTFHIQKKGIFAKGVWAKIEQGPLRMPEPPALINMDGLKSASSGQTTCGPFQEC